MKDLFLYFLLLIYIVSFQVYTNILNKTNAIKIYKQSSKSCDKNLGSIIIPLFLMCFLIFVKLLVALLFCSEGSLQGIDQAQAQ